MADPTLKARKDHGASAAAASELVPLTVGNPLVFHVSPSTEPPFRVDLTAFADGADPTSIAYCTARGWWDTWLQPMRRVPRLKAGPAGWRWAA